jgi:hypothetical protein
LLTLSGWLHPTLLLKWKRKKRGGRENSIENPPLGLPFCYKKEESIVYKMLTQVLGFSSVLVGSFRTLLKVVRFHSLLLN